MPAALSRDLTDALVQLLNAPFRYPAVWLPTAFLIGACVGSLLNVCILRLPRGRSLLWPGSTCGACFQRIQWRDNIPLVSYWLLRGRCGYCGAGFSSLYFWIELLTALSFAGLWAAEVVFNVREVGTVPSAGSTPTDPTDLFLIWIYHSVLVSLLIVVVGTTMHGDAVSRGVYRFGLFVGLMGAALAPWPEPVKASPWSAPTPLTFLGRARGYYTELVLIPAALQPWPVWQPPSHLPQQFAPTWGVATAVAGGLLGLALILVPSSLAGAAASRRVRENGLLLMMVGTFVGWQAVLLIALVASVLGLLQAAITLVWRRLARLPFCLHVAAATALVLLGSGELSLWVYREWNRERSPAQVAASATVASAGLIRPPD